MKFSNWLAIFCACLPLTCFAGKTDVVLETTHGKIVIRLNTEKAPQTSKNFLEYVNAGHYDGTIFHRVIADYVIQGGGYTSDMKQKPTRTPIKNEAGNGLSNKRGTVAMARTAAVDSATSQFFINVVDNTHLDHKSDQPHEFGYCVFGEVVEGMDVVDAIRKVPTDCGSKNPSGGCSGTYPPGMMDIPKQPVQILKIYSKK